MNEQHASQFTGVILAAGRGSRLGSQTDLKPKCLVELAGQSLLGWQRAALAAAGIERVVAVTGYRSELIDRAGIEVVHAKDWARTNMVGTLLRAFEELPPPYIVSYSDIAFSPKHVRKLLSAPGELAITYDETWQDLWSRRFDDPLSDAESFRIDEKGIVREIGGSVDDINLIQGQFMGLLMISMKAQQWITDATSTGDLAMTLDTTSLMQLLIGQGREIVGVPIRGGWAEVDDQHDLAVAEAMVTDGELLKLEVPEW